MHLSRSELTTAAKRLRPVWTAALSALSAAALSLVLPTAGALQERTNSVVFVVCAAGLYYLLRHAVSLVSCKRDALYCGIFGFILSFVYVAGRYVYVYEATGGLGAMLLIACMLTPAVASLLIVIARFFASSAEKPVASARPGFFERKHLFVIVFFAMLLCYIPCLLAYFPANINYDIANQTRQIVTGQYTTHHPLLHTLYIRACLGAGVKLFGGYTGGFALYAITQTALLVAAFSYAFGCIVRLTPGRNAFHWVVLLAFALYPVNHLFAVTTTKDVLAAGALLTSLSAFCMLLFFSKPRVKDNLPETALFVASSALAMLLRNGMVYAYIAFLLVLLFAAGKLRLRLLTPLVVSLALFFSVGALLRSALKSSDGSPVEMLSVPLQQVVRANIYYPERFTPEEQALFDALIEAKDRYLPHISDPIKEHIDADVILRNKRAYWDLYRSIGRKAPDAYRNAFLLLNLGVWYPDETTHANVHTDNQGYLHTSNWFYTWDKAPVPVEKHSLLPAAERLYNLFARENLHQKIPLVSMLFSPGFLCGTLFVLLFVLLYRRQYASLLAGAPLTAYWLVLLFAPCIYIRYVYPITVCLPLMTALAMRSAPADLIGRAEPRKTDAPAVQPAQLR